LQKIRRPGKTPSQAYFIVQYAIKQGLQGKYSRLFQEDAQVVQATAAGQRAAGINGVKPLT